MIFSLRAITAGAVSPGRISPVLYIPGYLRSIALMSAAIFSSVAPFPKSYLPHIIPFPPRKQVFPDHTAADLQAYPYVISLSFR